MKSAYLLLTTLILTALTLLAGCIESRHSGTMLENVEMRLETYPDSAKLILSQLDSQKRRMDRKPEAERMDFELSYAYAMNKAYRNFTDDRGLNKVTSYYEKNGTAYEKMMSQYLSACVYRDLDNWSKVMEHTLRAIEQYDSTDSRRHYRLLYKIYGLKSDAEYEVNLASAQIMSIDKAVYYAHKAGDPINALRILSHKGLAYSLRGDFDSVIVHNTRCAQEFRKIGAYDDANITEGATMDAFLNKKDFKRLKKAIDIFSHTTKVTGGTEGQKNNVFYYYKAEYYRNTGLMDSALYFLTKGLHESVVMDDKHAILEGLSAFYRQTGNNDSVSKYAILASELYDSICAIQNTDLAYNSLSCHEKKAATSAIDGIRRQAGGIVAVAVAIAFLATIAAIIAGRHARFWEQAEKDIQNRLTCFVEHSNSEIEKMREREKSQNTAKFEEARTAIYNSVFYKQALSACANKQYASYEIIKELTSLTEQQFPTFKSKVNPKGNMDNFNYSICILTKCGFKPSEISILLNASKSVISKRRRMLMKIIFNREGDIKDFDKLINYNT